MLAPEAIAIVDFVEPDTLVVPIPLEGAEAPVQEVLPEADQGYNYTRADGTVEHAATAEEAMKLCPVLGKLSLEQANVLLEIVAIGKERLAQDAPRQSEPRSHQEDERVPKPPNKDAPEQVRATVRNQPEATLAPHARQEAVATRATQDEMTELKVDHLYAASTDIIAEGDPRKAPAHVLGQEAISPANQAFRPEAAAQAALTHVAIHEQAAQATRISAEIQPVAVLAAESIPIPLRQTSAGLDMDFIPSQQTADPVEIHFRLDELTQVALPEAEEQRDVEGVLAFEQDEGLKAPVADDYHASTEGPIPLGIVGRTVERTEVVGEEVDGVKALPMIVTEIESTALPEQLEPEVALENFTKALEAFLERPTPDVFINEDEFSEQDAAQADSEEAALVPPPIVRRLAEKINGIEAEDESVIAPLAAEVAVLTIELQSLDEQETETIAAIESKLEGLCVTLLEQLNVEYDEVGIRLLVQVIMNSKFVALQTETSAPDLEREGTREAKHSLTTLSGVVADEKRHLEQLLGSFTLLCSQLKAIPFTKTRLLDPAKELQVVPATA